MGSSEYKTVLIVYNMCYFKDNLPYLIPSKIIKFLEENKEINLYDFGNKRKLDKLDFLTIKKCVSKDIIRNVKGQPTDSICKSYVW